MFCLYVYIHACLYVDIHAWCLWRPKAVTRSCRTGVTDVTDGCEAPCALNCSAISPVPAITFLMSQCYCVSRKLHYFWIGKDIISQLVVGSKVLLCPWPAAHIPFSFPDVVLCNNLASRRPVLLRLLHPLHWADLPPGCCAGDTATTRSFQEVADAEVSLGFMPAVQSGKQIPDPNNLRHIFISLSQELRSPTGVP